PPPRRGGAVGPRLDPAPLHREQPRTEYARSISCASHSSSRGLACCMPPETALGDDRDALYLDEHFRARQAGDGDQRARGIIVAEDLAAQLRETVAEPRIGDEDGHRHDVGQAPARLLERAPEPGKHFAHLAVEIGGERATAAVLSGNLPSQPHDAAAFGDNRLRIAARLRPRVLQIAPFHRIRHRVLPSTLVYTAAMQAAPLPDFEKAQTRAASWLRAWDRQGLHRTGTAGDLAGAEWLGQQAMALGAEVWVEEFAL